MMKKGIVIGICFCLLLPGLLPAEEIENTDPTLYTLDEIVITATKTEEKRKDISNAVVLLNEMDIQESSSRSLGELLANELGMDWRTLGNYGGAAEEIQIRGMQASGTQIFINGVNINSPSLGSADVGKIPLNNIERIEVIKGATSILYGSGAIGGAINIITKKIREDDMQFQTDVEYGSEDTYRLSLEQGMMIGGGLGYHLSANYRDTEGFRDNSDLDYKDVSLRVTLDRENILNASLYGSYVDREYGRPGIQPPKTTADYYVNGVKFYNSDVASLLDRGGDEDGLIALEIKSAPVDWLNLRFQGDYTIQENYNYSRYSYDGSGLKTWVTNTISDFEFNSEITPSDDFSVLIGAEYQKTDWENRSISLDPTGSDISGTDTTVSEDLNTVGYFGEIQYRPCTFAKLLIGTRFEDHSEFGTETIPRFGLVINPAENTAIKLSHGKHFLAPTPNDLFWPTEDWGWGMGSSGNPDLKPETGWHTDVTVEQILWDNAVFISGSYFKWDMDNRILWASDADGFWQPENLRSYEAQGFELGARMGPFKDFIFSLSYTYLDAEEEAEEYHRTVPSATTSWVTHPATYSPDNQFKGTVSYTFPFGLYAATTARYVSERPWYRDETSDWMNYRTVVYYLDAYWTLDLKLEQAIGDHWIVALQGTNLFDEAYDTYFGTFYDENTFQTTVEKFPGVEQSFYLSVKYTY